MIENGSGQRRDAHNYDDFALFLTPDEPVLSSHSVTVQRQWTHIRCAGDIS
jgi:hypothetical protein